MATVSPPSSTGLVTSWLLLGSIMVVVSLSSIICNGKGLLETYFITNNSMMLEMWISCWVPKLQGQKVRF